MQPPNDLDNFSKQENKVKKHLLTALGLLSVGLGVVGMFLPILPTTPFLLLAAYCFVRSNRRLYDKLLSHKVLGPYISDFMLHKTIPKKVKAVSILTLWITIAVSVLLVKLLWVKILLLGIAVGVSAHILSFKSR